MALGPIYIRNTKDRTEEQIRSLTTIGRKAGYIEADEGRLIHRAFVLNDRTAADIMTPACEVVTLDVSQSISEATQVARASVYSRFPVINGTPDEIGGIVMIRELLEACEDGRQTDLVSELVRPPFLLETTCSPMSYCWRFENAAPIWRLCETTDAPLALPRLKTFWKNWSERSKTRKIRKTLGLIST